MTNTQEVLIPVDLLRRTAESIIPSHPLTAELRKYIPKPPAPPAIGDVLTEEQIVMLPPKSVLRDRDGDIWVMTERGPAYVSVSRQSISGAEAEPYDTPVDYAAVLVSLPDGRD